MSLGENNLCKDRNICLQMQLWYIRLNEDLLKDLNVIRRLIIISNLFYNEYCYDMNKCDQLRVVFGRYRREKFWLL